MKLITLVLAAVICGSAFAAVDCTTFTTQDTCTDTTCKYTEKTKTCLTKCTALTKDTCTNADNTANCEAATQTCKPNSDTLCTSANGGSEEACKNIDAPCNYTKAVQEECTTKQTILDACEAIKNEGECTGDCTYKPSEYQSCTNADNICEQFTDCTASQCKRTFTKCDPVGDCAGVAQGPSMESDCNAQKGCAYLADGGSGSPTCTTDTAVCGTSICDADKCDAAAATGTCGPKPGDTTCADKTKDTCSQDPLCKPVLSQASCKAKADLCTPCDADKCTITQAGDSSKCEPTDCPADITACGTKCTVTPFSCNVRESAKCNATAATKDQCTGFCNFSSTGTCAAASTDGSSGVILAFTSLIAFLSMAL